jgi:ketosteroid isomerase-like protein
MSQERAELVRAVLPPEGSDLVELFSAGGGPISTGGLVSDDATVNWTSRSAETSREGPEGFREGWTDWLEPWETYRIYYDDVVERGDRVIALVRLRGVTKRDGVEMEHEAAAVFYFEGDQVVEMTFNLDREDALAG